MHIAVQYRQSEARFFVKDNGTESGTYLKVEKPLRLIQGEVLAFGESSMAITAAGETLALKFLGGSYEDKSLYRYC